jgi:hypothetical protein
MAMTVEALYQEALCLSNESRVVLAERLLGSVDPDPVTIEVQTAMARQRLMDLENGEVQPISGDEGLRRVSESVRKRARG